MGAQDESSSHLMAPYLCVAAAACDVHVNSSILMPGCDAHGGRSL